MVRRSNYDKFPFVEAGPANECSAGWDAIATRLAPHLLERHAICVECYPGVLIDEMVDGLRSRLGKTEIFLSQDCLKTPEELRAMLDPLLGPDRVFGRKSDLSLEEYFSMSKIEGMRLAAARAVQKCPVLVIGAGASRVSPPGAVSVYADMARWEIQLRWRRRQMGNLGLNNVQEDFALKFKCAFFAEWRAADRQKKRLLPEIEFLLDTNQLQSPKLIGGDTFRRAVAQTTQRPFRVVPYFDPGPWGGHWMEEAFDLPRDVPNHAWCFDCVPEENSLLLGFGEQRVEVPAIDLVFSQPRALLGDAVYERFGAEFPIRFDFLDTVGGGNLSLQVHPLTKYMIESLKFCRSGPGGER